MAESYSEYYFVPLGRERGGLLERLGLPPDADMQSIGVKHGEYLKNLEKAYKEKRKPLKKKRDAKEITLEEYNAADEALQAVWTKGEAELNELKAKYELVLAERRLASQQGRPAEAAVWEDLFAECCGGAARSTDPYLVMLGLPRDANEARVAQEERKFREKLELDFKQKQQQLRGRLKTNEIARDVFNAEASAMQEARQKVRAELDESKQQHEQALCWREAAIQDSEQLWEALLNLRSIPQLAPEWVAQISDRWLRGLHARDAVEDAQPDGRCLDLLADVAAITDAELRQRMEWLERVQTRELARLESDKIERVRGGELALADAKVEFLEQKKCCVEERSLFAKRAKELRQAVKQTRETQRTVEPSQRLQPSGRQQVFERSGPGLAALVELIDERNLMHLLAADSLWGELQFTNRDHWRRRIAEWATEIGQLGPRLQQQAGSKSSLRGGATPDFPSLCQAPNRAVDRLETEELGDIGQQPDRNQAFRGREDPLLAALLQAMLGKKQSSSEKKLGRKARR